MRDDPFYLSKAFTLKASLGVLSVDGNFGKSIAYLQFFVKFRVYAYLKKALVGYGFSLPSKLTSFNFLSLIFCLFSFDGRLKPYPTSFKLLKDYNLTYFSKKLFFNVKITLSKIWS